MGSLISYSILSILLHYTYLTMIPLFLLVPVFLSIAQLHAYPGNLLIETIGGGSTPSVSCPKEVPEPNSECNSEELSCEYGKTCCCGKCWPSEKAFCFEGIWSFMSTDRCILGDRGCNGPLPGSKVHYPRTSKIILT